MQKLLEWIAAKFDDPFSILFFVLGVFLLLLGLTGGFDLDLLKGISVSGLNQAVSGVLGLIFVGIAYYLSHRARSTPPPARQEGEQSPGPLAVPASPAVSADVTKLMDRRRKLTSNQSRLLEWLESMHQDNLTVEFASIHGRFDDYVSGELYYRLEHLCLLGFLAKEQEKPRTVIRHVDDLPDTDGSNWSRTAYRLSDGYARALMDGPTAASTR